MEEFKEKKILIIGTGGSGKTIYAKNLWNSYKLPMAYDINGDFKNLKGGIAYNPKDIDGEVIDFLNLYKKISEEKKVDALFFDDADAYFSYEMINRPEMKDLIIRHRNKYKVSLIFIGKRPQNLPTLITNNCHILKVFLTEGLNAIQRLNDIDERITALFPELAKIKYSYIFKEEGKEPILKAPVKI